MEVTKFFRPKLFSVHYTSNQHKKLIKKTSSKSGWIPMDLPFNRFNQKNLIPPAGAVLSGSSCTGKGLPRWNCK
jgi:hypothetical protein